MEFIKIILNILTENYMFNSNNVFFLKQFLGIKIFFRNIFHVLFRNFPGVLSDIPP